LNINYNKVANTNKIVLPQTFTKLDNTKLDALLNDHNWQNVLTDNDPETCTNNFIEEIKYYISQCETEHTRNRKVVKLKPWITIGIINSIRERDRLKKRCMKNKDDEGLVGRFKNYRNTLNNLIKITKNNYYKGKILDAGKNTRKVWEVINEATNNSTNKTDVT